MSRFLCKGGAAYEEAAFALGLMRTPEAFQALEALWEREAEPSLSGVLLSAMALTGQPEAFDLLIRLIADDAPGAGRALNALAALRPSSALRSRIEAAVDRGGNHRIRQAYAQQFPKAGG